MVVGLAAAPDSLDPALASSPEALQAVWLVYTPLLTYARGRAPAGTAARPRPGREGARALRRRAAPGSFTLRAACATPTARAVRASDFERGIAARARAQPAVRRAARAGSRRIDADDRTRRSRIRLDATGPRCCPTRSPRPGRAPVPAGHAGARAGRAAAGRRARTRSAAATAARPTCSPARRGFDLPGMPRGNVDVIAARVVPDAGRADRRGDRGRPRRGRRAAPPASGSPRSGRSTRTATRAPPRCSTHYVRLDVGTPPVRRRGRAPGGGLRPRRAHAHARWRRLPGARPATCSRPPCPATGRPDPCPYGERERQRRPGAGARAGGGLAGRGRARAGRRRRRTAARARSRATASRRCDKIGLRARRGAHAARSARALSCAFATRLPAVPHPRALPGAGGRRRARRAASACWSEGPAGRRTPAAGRGSTATWWPRRCSRPYGVGTTRHAPAPSGWTPRTASRFHPVLRVWTSRASA